MPNIKKKLAITVLAATLGGCASTSSVSVVTPGLTPKEDGAWLIFVETPENHHRNVWEEQCVAAWRKKGLIAKAAVMQFPELKQHNEHLISRATAAGFDQLIVIDATGTLLHSPTFQQQAPMLTMRHDQQGTSIKNYRQLANEQAASQYTTAEIHPLRSTGKTLRVNIQSHEANNIKRISRSQCQALVKYITSK